jgi:UDP-N-acetylglucosamine transferase subunit ALG13
MALKMAALAPKIFFRIFREHRKLQSIIKEYDIDIVLSDNRFGLWSYRVPTVFITHQLHIITSAGFGMVERVINWLNYFFIKKFDVCWVPDFSGETNISGSLSKRNSKQTNIRYIGMLSRFHSFTELDIIDDSFYDSDLLVILSGPEPQRTLFERIIMEQLDGTTLKTIIIRGIPEHSDTIKPHSSNIKIFNHLDDPVFFTVIKKTKLIISRPGYTTIMDLFYTGGKSVFIPTPGQTEQEYLAKRLAQKNIAPWFRQDDFILQKAIKVTETHNGFIPVVSATHPDFSLLLKDLFVKK